MAKLKVLQSLFLAVFLVSGMSSGAQTFLSGNPVNTLSGQEYLRPVRMHDAIFRKNWSLTSYSGINAGFLFFNGAGATIVSAPAGIQLNRRLNSNLSAFAGVSVAPAYLNFNRSFSSADFTTGFPNSIYRPGQLGVYSRAALGLQYVNDEKTFSISGSIGVERSSNPFLLQRAVRRDQSPVTGKQ